MSRARWRVERSRGSAASLHERDVVPDSGRCLWVHEVERPALVLGSTQPESLVDRSATARAGVEVVRRRSGGGAVLVEPGGVVWVDVVIPPEDPRWDADVGRATHWVGEAWAAALEGLGLVGLEVHRGGLVRSPWSAAVCFGGLGPGEVTAEGRKVVGIAQRRTRAGARFQTAALLRWEPSALVSLLQIPDRAAAAADLQARATGVARASEAVVEAVVASFDARG